MNPSELRRRSLENRLRRDHEQGKSRSPAALSEADQANIIALVSRKVEECVAQGETECCVLLVKNFELVCERRRKWHWIFTDEYTSHCLPLYSKWLFEYCKSVGLKPRIKGTSTKHPHTCELAIMVRW